MIPNILSIAGSDSSGGAGIQADIKAISANGGYAMTVVTALTAQNTQGVRAVRLADRRIVDEQIAAIRDDITLHAVKIGMLGDAEIIRTVARGLDGLDCPVVLDPVMVAKSGDRLLARAAVDALRELLLPQADVITPNLPEAADLLGTAEARSRDAMRVQARALLALGARAVVLKGGHLAGNASPDLCLSAKTEVWIDAPRVATANTHGTGCSFASALAVHLSAGTPLAKAANEAKCYVSGAIAASEALAVGSGHGPIHHFHSTQKAAT